LESVSKSKSKSKSKKQAVHALSVTPASFFCLLCPRRERLQFRCNFDPDPDPDPDFDFDFDGGIVRDGGRIA